VLGDREIVVAREISKVHEEFLRGTLSKIIAQLAEQTVKGEITLVVHGATKQSDVAEEELKAEICQLAEGGMGVKAIAEFLSDRYHLSRRKVYQMALQLRKSSGSQ
jgi:16S rRNA (cytidine1402-2'-O)-methyltransferase